MENKGIARQFRLLAQLMEIYDENPFKVKAIASAAQKIDKAPVRLEELPLAELEKQEGIGKSTAQKITEFLTEGSIKELEALKDKTPVGVLEMLAIKGLGPKKIQTIWRELQIDTTADLYYACNENRLVEAKGFGSKTQDEIRKILEFSFRSKGKYLYPLAYTIAENWLKNLQSLEGISQIVITGALRRRCEIVDSIDLLIESTNFEHLSSTLQHHLATELDNASIIFREILIGNEPVRQAQFRDAEGILIRLYHSLAPEFYKILFLSTGVEQHVELLTGKLPVFPQSEFEIYERAGLQYIEPELREGLAEIERAASHSLKPLVLFSDLRGTIHNHSTYSDGVHTLEEMAMACIEMGLEYLCMCDHSQSAFYANGLNVERLEKQHEEIDRLNSKLKPFHIFKGIESDILNDGNLDYPEAVLQGFDLIVASIHSNLRMDIEKATSRLLKAIENKYTTILGHPTGRLLLGREGYPIDHKRIIDACAANQVVIEINSNPNRLDLDWRWLDYGLQKNVMFSINPDAHRKEGLHDMQYGVLMARKGALSKEHILNALGLDDFMKWLQKNKSSKINSGKAVH